MMSYDVLRDLVEKRRTVRRFRSEPVPDEYIDKIIDVARWAPSGFNMQPWEFVVVKAPELKDKIVEIINHYWAPRAKMEATREPWQKNMLKPMDSKEMDYKNAPVFIILYGDNRTRVGLPMAVRYDYDRLQTIHISSLANTFLYMHLAATALGLGSQWVSGISTPAPNCMIKDLLGIPMEMEVYDMMALGYKAFDPRPKFIRDKSEMVHYDYCGRDDFRTDDEVKDFIRRSRTWVMASHNRKPDEKYMKP